jgi:hypothetical protein
MIRIFTMCIALFLICCSTNLKAASADSTFKNQYTLYINQPIGFATKVRLTLENRFTKNSALLVNYTVFYGMYPGQHGYLEYRRYFSLSEGMEIAPYLKVGGGHSFQTAGSYGFGGIGVGEKFYLDRNKRFSIYCKQGLKLPLSLKINQDLENSSGGLDGLFYISGPGAFIDIQFNLGYRF